MFEPINKLEEALIAGANNPLARSTFYKLLLECDLLVVGTMSQPKRRLFVSANDAKLSVPSHRSADGNLYIPVFSSVERLRAAIREPQSYVKMNGRSLLTLLVEILSHNDEETVFLNPGLSYGKELTLSEIRQLLDGSLFKDFPQSVRPASKITLEQITNYPDYLVDALKKILPEYSEIEAAYIAQMYDDASAEPPHLLIGVEASGDFSRVVEAIGKVIGEVAKDVVPIDIVRMTNNDLSEKMLKATQPFYLKD